MCAELVRDRPDDLQALQFDAFSCETKLALACTSSCVVALACASSCVVASIHEELDEDMLAALPLAVGCDDAADFWRLRQMDAR